MIMTNNLFKNLLSLAVVASLMLLYSCGEDEETLPDLPTISATPDAASYEFGATAEITIDVTAPGELSGVNWTFTVDAESGDKEFNSPADIGLSDTETGLQTAIMEIVLDQEFYSGATVSIEFEVVDKSNQSTTDIVEFTVGEASPPASGNVGVILGGQLNATTGSFYDVVANEVYNYATTRDEQSANVDFLFFYGETNGYTIAALDDDQAAIAFDAAIGVDGSLSEETMETRNPTRFKALTEATANDFEGVETVADLNNLVGEVAPEATLMNGLEAGDVFGFQFATDRGATLGLIHISAVGGTQGSDRTITFDVKFEEPQ